MPMRRRIFSGPSYSAEAMAYFAAMAAAGYSATNTEKSAADRWIKDRKSDGTWDKIDRAYLNIGTLASALICCKSLTSRVAVNSPTASNGLSYNGSTSYAKSDINVSALTLLQANDAHSFCIMDSSAIPGGTIIGGKVSLDQFYLHGGILA